MRTDYSPLALGLAGLLPGQKPRFGMVEPIPDHPLIPKFVILLNEGGGNSVFGIPESTGSIVNAAWVADGLSFDGVDGNINFGKILNNLPQVSIVACINVKSDGEGELGYLVEKSATDTSGFRFRTAETDASSAIAFRVDYSTSDLQVYSYGGPVTFNTDHQVAVTWDGTANASGVKLYVDSTETSYWRQYNGSGVRLDDSGNDFIIGQRQDGAYTVDGTIKYKFIYANVLSKDEILAINSDPYCWLAPKFHPTFAGISDITFMPFWAKPTITVY